VDSVGGMFNAFTGEERVGYFVKLSAAKKRTAYDVLSDMMLNSKFDAVEIDRERGVIIEEIRMYNDDPASLAQIDFKLHFYGDQPLGWDIAGPEENIMAVKRDDFLHYRDKFYTAGNCVIVAAGGVTHEENMALVSEFFKFKKGDEKPSVEPYRSIPGKRTFLRKRDIEQAHIVMGFPIPGEEEKEQPALKILVNAMGGTMSSRLFHEIREKRGLAYYIRASRFAYTDTGAIKVSAGVNLKKTGEAISCVMEEIRKAVKTGITKEELEKGKENIKGRTDLSLEDSMSTASLYAAHEVIYGTIKTPEEYAAELDAVTLDEVNAAAAKFLDPANIKLAVLGPYDDVTMFDKALD